MSFQQGLSGLQGASKHLEVVGNNVANVEAGFGLQLDFGDVDTLNFGFLAPLQPIVGSDAPVMISAWYAHGFNVKAD